MPRSAAGEGVAVGAGHLSLTRRLVAAPLAWAIGVSGPVSFLWDVDLPNRHGARILMAAAALWTALLALGAWRRWPGVALLAGVAGLAVRTTPVIGGRTVVLTLAAVAIAWGALAEWSPLPGWPGRRERTAALALAPVLAAEVLWPDHRSFALSGILLLVGALVLEGYHRAPGIPAPVHRLASHAGRVMRLPEARRSGAAAWGRLRQRSWRASLRRVWPPKDRRGWSFLAAVVVGFGLRLAWAVAMTRSEGGPPVIGDWYTTWNLRIASQLGRGDMPSLGGHATAFWPVGYGAVLAPVSWVSNHTGLVSLRFGAALVNVVVGTVTIALTAALASRWLGRTTRNSAAWIMALAPGHIFATSAAVPEPLLTMLVMAVLVVASRLRARLPGPSTGALVGLGALVGAAVLVGDRATVLVLIVPFLVGRPSRESWRAAGRLTGRFLVGVILVLGPWTVRNGIQVGWWSPSATSVSEGLCTAKYGYDRVLLTNTADDRLLALARDCVRNAPLDNPAFAQDTRQVMPPRWVFDRPDEARYARRNMSKGVRWFASHPWRVAARAPMRIYEVAGDDRTGGLDFAEHFGTVPLVSSGTHDFLARLADGWYYAVVGLAALALLRLPLARRAWPVWGTVLVLLLQPLLGPYGFSRHFFPAYPLLAVLAAGIAAGPAIRPSPAGSDDAPAP